MHYVQNVTDIDEPLLERAERDQDDWIVLGLRETALFREDMEALRVLPPREFVGAVEAIPRSPSWSKLVASGAAYRIDDPEYPDVYHDVSATGHFGYESNYDLDTMLAFSAERGGDPTGRASATGSTRCCGAPRDPVSRPGSRVSGAVVPAGTWSAPRSR